MTQDNGSDPAASLGSVVYCTFDEWYSEIEGFSLRGERLAGPASELRAAFAAGQSGMRLTDAEKDAAVLAYNQMRAIHADNVAATLRGLLERLGGET